jgi:hypothetical protein
VDFNFATSYYVSSGIHRFSFAHDCKICFENCLISDLVGGLINIIFYLILYSACMFDRAAIGGHEGRLSGDNGPPNMYVDIYTSHRI